MGTSSDQMASNQTQPHTLPYAHFGDNEIEPDLPKFSHLVSDRLKPWSNVSLVHEATPFPEVPFVVSDRVNTQTEGTLSRYVIYSHLRISKAVGTL